MRASAHPVPRLGSFAIATVVALILALLAARAASGDEPAPADTSLAPVGEQIFQRHCASCHGVQAQGGGPAAPSLKVAPPDLTRIAQRRKGEFPRGEIGRFIDGRFDVSAHGTREMPVWGRQFGATVPQGGLAEEIARGNIAVLLDYLESIQVKPEAAE